MIDQVRTGAFYRTRGGKRVGPAQPNQLDGRASFPWKIGGRSYTDRGTFFFTSKPSEFDLVAEWSDATDPAIGAPEFPTRLVPREEPARIVAVPSIPKIDGDQVSTTFLNETIAATREAIGRGQFRVSAGKTYLARNGAVYGPLEDRTDDGAIGEFRFRAPTGHGFYDAWREDGTCSITPGRTHPRDLVAELVSPIVEPEELPPVPAVLVLAEEPRDDDEGRLEYSSIPAGAVHGVYREVAAGSAPRGHTALFAEADLVIDGGVIIKSRNGERVEKFATREEIEVADLILVNGVVVRQGPAPNVSMEVELRAALLKANERIAELSAQIAEVEPDPERVMIGIKGFPDIWDHYAGHALNGILGCSREFSSVHGVADRVAVAAKHADAIMAERAKRGIGQ